ncbi:hypothetical protein, partial [uncultured Parasutterella sp.]|uniref:hypothetical protein n=1 Tax=uncultured Parasutterella sp. TaxID=1263098 RepID=UPI0025B55CF3
NAKISIEKDHVQAIEALNGFNKELEESEKQIVEAVTEFKKKKKEELSDADHKTKKPEPPERIKPDLRAPIQPKPKDAYALSEGSTDSASDYDNHSVSSKNLNPNGNMANKATLSNNTQRKPYNLDNSNFSELYFENDKADQLPKARNTMNQQKLTSGQRSESLSEDEKSESEKNNPQGRLEMSDSRIFQQSHKDKESLSQVNGKTVNEPPFYSAIYDLRKYKNDDLNEEEDLLHFEKVNDLDNVEEEEEEAAETFELGRKSRRKQNCSEIPERTPESDLLTEYSDH